MLRGKIEGLHTTQDIFNEPFLIYIHDDEEVQLEKEKYTCAFSLLPFRIKAFGYDVGRI